MAGSTSSRLSRSLLGASPSLPRPHSGKRRAEREHGDARPGPLLAPEGNGDAAGRSPPPASAGGPRRTDPLPQRGRARAALDCVDEPRPLHSPHDFPLRSLVLRLRSSQAPLSLDLGSALPESGAAAG